MRVLITGAGGFVGGYLVDALTKAGFEVGRGTRNNLDEVLNLIGHCECIVHAAASTPISGVTVEQMVADNVLLTKSLLEAAKDWKVKKFILFSSISMYGTVNVPILEEGTTITNPSVYGATKFLCEQLLKEQNISGLALRLPGILGPKAHKGNWLPGVADKLLKGETIGAYNLDKPFNNAVHVDDLAKLIIKVLKEGWSGYDAMVLGAKGVLRVKSVITRLARALDVEAKIEEIPTRQHSFVISSRHAMQDWGYDPMEIEKMVDQYGAELAYEKV